MRLLTRGALIGSLLGILATALVFPRSSFDWENPGHQAAAGWLLVISLPTSALFDWAYRIFYPAEWDLHVQLTMAVAPALNGALLGGGLLAFARRWLTSALLRKAGWVAACIELVLIALLAYTGVPSPFAPLNLPAEVATFAHTPGIILLTFLGLCCGYTSHLVISDFWPGPVQHPSPIGLGLLFLSNGIMLMLTLRVVFGTWARIHRLRSAPTPSA